MDFEKVNDPGATNIGPEGAIVFVTSVAFNALIDGLLLMLAVRLAKRKGAVIPRFGYWVCVFFAFVAGNLAGTGSAGINMRLMALGRYVKENM